MVEQEEYLRSINTLEHIYSDASFGKALIELEFPFGVDINEALILVNNALSQVRDYPENVDEPHVVAESFSSNAFMYLGVKALKGSGREVTMEQDWVEDNIKTRLERIDGVSSVRLFGGVSRQINIFLSPSKLSARGLTVVDVRDAIRARNKDVSGGDMDFGKRRYLLRTLGRFQTLEQLKALIIAERDGAFIRLMDVGTLEMANEEKRAFAMSGGEPIINVAVNREIGANVIDVKNRVNAAVASLNNGILRERGLTLDLHSEDARYVEQSIITVVKNLVIGSVLAVSVLLLFLRSASATLIGAIGIPLCVLASFLGLSVSGRTINVISMAGIAFAIGMTLDNSIVVLENIARHINLGKKRFDAAVLGIYEVWPAIAASTATTVLVFLPLIFLDMEAGQLYSDIAIAISSSILMSMLIAFTLIPAFSSRFLDAGEMNSSSFFNYLLRLSARAGGVMSKALLSATSWLLKCRVRQLWALFVTVIVTLCILIFMIPAAEYLPEGEEAKIIASMMAPPGYNIKTMQDILKKIDPEFSSQVNVSDAGYQKGDVSVPPLASHFVLVRPGYMMFATEPVKPEHVPAHIAVIKERFQAIPGMRSFVVRGSIFSDNRGGARSINIELTGRNLETLYSTALNVLNEVGNLFEGAQVNSNPSPTTLNMSQPIVYVLPDWERAAEMGVSQEELGYSIWAYSDGAFADEFFLEDEKIDIFLFTAPGVVNKPKDLENIMLYTRAGEQVPLSTVAQVKETVGSSSISRVDGMRTVTLQLLPPRSIALESAVQIVKMDLLDRLKKENVIPSEIGVKITGATSQLEQTRSMMSASFILALLVTYLLLVSVFSHWGYPLVIITIVPIGISGGIVGLWAYNLIANNLDLIGLPSFHQPFDVITMLGFLILIGTVVNNPILIVERSVVNLKEKKMQIQQAIKEAVEVRLRPVMMSTITTVFGLSPLVFLPGSGSELYRGLGAVVLFGLLFSSIVTLTILPVFLSLIFSFVKKEKSVVSSTLSL